MLVQCPGCRTTYRVSEEAVATPKPTFRCSRCKNVFDLVAKPTSKPARERAEAPSPTGVDSQELSFSFSTAEAPAETNHSNNEERIADLSAPAIADNGSAARANEAPLPDSEPQQEWNFFKEREKDFVLSDEPTPRSGETSETPFVFARERQAATDENIERTAPVDTPMSLTPLFLVCGLILVVCASLTLLYKARPQAVEQMLKSVPLLGPSISRNDYLRQGIVLQTSLTRFQRIQGNREVFILSGSAVNRNRVRVREVKIEGVIYGRDGGVIERRVITIGNAISPKIIHDLTQQEILDLQKTGPVKRFEIQPDESASFSIVFFPSNAVAQSFGYRVLSAEEA
ncbi:MAG TPA: zinc-ribbon domain-containing protein [Candidatus Binatia bacterium]|nr:zinc-ribbon domain-containing protein [Candidatus Binatia bacterium]